MDVLLISRCPPFPLYFGDRLIPYHLARQLSQRRHYIDLIAFYTDPADIQHIPRYERYFRHIQLIPEPVRGPLKYLERLTGNHFFPTSASEAWSPEMWEAMRKRIRAGNYDAIHLFGGVQVYEYRELVTQWSNVIVPYESYSLYLQNAIKRGRTGNIAQRIQIAVARRYERRMFRGYDRVVVLAEEDAQALRALQPDLPLRVIPNGVDTDYFVPSGHEPDEPTLLFIGNYEYAPNVDAALRLARRIFPAVKRRVPKARLIIVGNAPPAELRAMAGSSIEVTGRVPDVRPYLEQALVFVSALRMGAGIKNKVLEAMAMQKAIVATRLSCDGIALEHEKHVLLAETSDEITKAIIRLMKDAALRQQIARASRELIEQHYTWMRVADQYEELYREIGRQRFGRSD